MRTLILSFLFLVSTSRLFAQEFVVFNDVWTGTGSTTNIRIDNISQVNGNGFRINSIGNTFPTSGNDVPCTLTYTNNGVLFSYTGIVKGEFANGQIINGLYFLGNDNSAFLLVVPGREAQFSSGTDQQGNSSGIVGTVNGIKSSQSSTVIINLTNALAEVESDTKYSIFTLTLSKDRTTNNSVTFTPSLVNGTAVSGEDFTTGIEYTTSLTEPTVWTSATSGVSVAFNVNTIYLRVPLKNDNLPECQEQYILQTGIFTGDGANEISNFEGVYGTAKISDDNDPLTWTGTTSSDWDVSSNYDLNLSPDSCYCISLPSSSTPNNPSISSSSTKNTLKNLTINSGGKISIGSGATLNVIGDVNINNPEDGITGEGTLELNGTTPQTISGNGLVKNINFNNSNGVTISSGSNKLNISGVLSVSSGTITTNDNLVLKASSTEEGIVGTISTCPTDPFNGNVIVERYIPATARSLRFITPGVYSSTITINQNWQEGVNETNKFNYGVGAVNPKNPNPGYGTHISGSTDGANGLDATITGNPSMYWFENIVTGYGWQTITNTDTTKFRRPGQAFAIMIRGDRSIDMTSNIPAPTSTILRTKGRLTNCSYTFTSDINSFVPLSAAADSYSFIGNPFWSIINWSRVSKTNIDNKIYYFDPAISGTNSVGGYVALNMVDADESNDQKSININGRLSRYLQPGQGFFVKNSNSGNPPEITFEEADKENSNAKKLEIFSKNPSGNISENGDFENTRVRTSRKFENIHVSLYLQKNLNIAPADGFLISYNSNFSDAIGKEDANKLSNQDENMFALFNGNRFSILGLQSSLSIKSDTIPISLTNLYDQDYVMRLDFSKDINPEREVYLINKATGTRQKLDLTKSFDFAFRPPMGVKSISDYAIVVNSRKIENRSRVRKSLEGINNPVVNGVLQFTLPVSETQGEEINKNVQVFLLDLSGRLVLSKTMSSSNNLYKSLNIDELRSGAYILNVVSSGKTYSKKIMKQ